ncbi:neutral zinc metallopeptidase [Caldimonas thermodepolymerans]|uniref:KPN_02809 family neutral zinc metallopeptidase n=1 Tax=Caldimonas thermodepolymerans TaxID=215580 RepID=UPI0022366CB1|nr:neutral zinc metallopeptidase [Caldimonas thermodepolymerans]UZG43420.1 zinc metallopeptidase [Caldimonas thermodepolymerans]
MKWEGRRASRNVEDRRASGGMPLGGRGLGLGTVAVALVLGWVLGINPLTLLGMLDGGMGAPQEVPSSAPPADDTMAQFVAVVLADTEDTWQELFARSGATYREPRLVLFRGSTPTACGQGQAAMGPFYCPADERVYIDLSFYETLKHKLGAPGDFAQAYVIAHEVGHHVQKLLGLTEKVHSMRSRLSQVEYNALSVRLELQADCFSGVWAHHADRARQLLEQGDIEEALNAAAQIGDDNLQRRAGGTVVPESFTHGTGEQRVAWFRRGLESGSFQQCNTFEVRAP